MSVQLVSHLAMVVIVTLSALPVAIQPRILQPDFGCFALQIYCSNLDVIQSTAVAR